MIELNACGYTAAILPERGGSCVDLVRYGAHVLRTPQGEASYASNPYLFGTPLLFFPNRISGGRFQFEGREYVLPVNEPSTGCFIHGTLHETAFEVIKRREDYVSLRYRATQGSPYLTFPHAFTLMLEWTLSQAGLYQKVTFTNDSRQNMPVALAFHTTFRTPFTADSAPENMRLTLDTAEEYGRNMQTYLPDGHVWVDFPGKQEMARGELAPCRHTISRLFRMGDKQEMHLTDVKKGLDLTYRAGDTYGYWMVFNGGSREYLCVEPQSWLSNCPNAPFAREEHGFDFIEPGKTRTYESWLCVEKV